MVPGIADAVIGTGADHHLGSFKIVSRRVSEDALQQTVHYFVFDPTCLLHLLDQLVEDLFPHRTTSQAISALQIFEGQFASSKGLTAVC